MPETLDTIAAKIDALSKSTDERFSGMEKRFSDIDRQFDETKAQFGVKIEAVESKVDKVFDEVIAMRAETKRNAREHAAFTKRLDNHDLRILALEKPGPAKP